MIEIQTPHGTVLLDDEDAWVLDGRNIAVYMTNAKSRPTTYPMVYAGSHLVGRLLLQPPKGMTVDHINRDPLDNRRENLRLATRQQQVANRRGWGKNEFGYRGVYREKHTGRWRARISMPREASDRQYAHPFRYQHLGAYPSIHTAALHWNKGAISRWGSEYTNLNDVPCFADHPQPREDRCPTCHASCHCCCVCL